LVSACSSVCARAVATPKRAPRPRCAASAHAASARAARASQAAIRLVSRIVPSMRADELQQLLAQLVPPLVDAFKSPSADVRKAVTFALVHMHGVLGEALMPHLAELSSSQHKLVTAYINRAAKPDAR
jgi:CLIP-associating protein 1/2